MGSNVTSSSCSILRTRGARGVRRRALELPGVGLERARVLRLIVEIMRELHRLGLARTQRDAKREPALSGPAGVDDRRSAYGYAPNASHDSVSVASSMDSTTTGRYVTSTGARRAGISTVSATRT